MSLYRDPALLADPAAGWALVRRPGAAGFLRWLPRLLLVPPFFCGLMLLALGVGTIAGTGFGPHATGARSPGVWTENTVLVLLIVLVWNACTAAAVASLWLAPLRARWLYRHGATSPGTIVAKRVRSGPVAPYELSYAFALPGGSRHEGTMIISSRKLYDSVDIGERVTVLHPAYRPGPSLIYDCGDYRWAGDTASR